MKTAPLLFLAFVCIISRSAFATSELTCEQLGVQLGQLYDRLDSYAELQNIANRKAADARRAVEQRQAEDAKKQEMRERLARAEAEAAALATQINYLNDDIRAVQAQMRSCY